MCEYTSVPAQRGARIVVSLIGESLSPKIAPQTAAATRIAGSAPIPKPAPNIARPIVPAVVQLVPVTTEKTQQDKNVHK